MPTVYKDVEIEIELDDFSDDELLSELKNRDLIADFEGCSSERTRELLETIWHQRRTGQNYEYALDRLIWVTLGRLI